MGRYQSGQMGLTVNQVLRLRRFESSPSHNIGAYISWLDSHPDKVEVAGSSPAAPTK